MNEVAINKRAVIVIPLYKSDLTKQEEFSIANTLSVLTKWKVIFIAPHRLKADIERWKRFPLDSEQCVFFEDKYFKSVAGYNELLMSRFFYEKFILYEFMLIVQTDAIAISDQVELWCSKNYSYIGAPWFEGLEQPIEPLKMIGVGNGGFSLRKVNDFISALSICRHVPNKRARYNKKSLLNLARYVKHNYIYAFNVKPLLPKVNEDVFWGELISSVMPEFTVPSVQEAALFSFEVCPEYLFNITNERLPFGCHAWEKYNKKFWVERLNLPKYLS
jgi:hypothetical protein